MSPESKSLIQIPPQGQPVYQFLIVYALTFGLYIYFWFYRNYKNFKEYKKLDLNPEFRVLALFILTIIPYFIYGAILGSLGGYSFPPGVAISFNLIMVAIETVFIIVLFRTIKESIGRTVEKSPIFLIVIVLFFIFGGLRKVLPTVVAYHWWLEILLIWLQGGALSLAQQKVNIFWKAERHELGIL